jgi:Protein of unknown function (DUF2510)
MNSTAPPAAWHVDPTYRNQLRYWDGGAWTDNVSNHGQVGVDPVAGATSGHEPLLSEPVLLFQGSRIATPDGRVLGSVEGAAGPRVLSEQRVRVVSVSGRPVLEMIVGSASTLGKATIWNGHRQLLGSAELNANIGDALSGLFQKRDPGLIIRRGDGVVVAKVVSDGLLTASHTFVAQSGLPLGVVRPRKSLTLNQQLPPDVVTLFLGAALRITF